MNSIVSRHQTHSSLPPLDPDFDPNIRFDDLKERPWQGGRGSLLPGNNQGSFNENSLNTLKLSAKIVRLLQNCHFGAEMHDFQFAGVHPLAEAFGPLPNVCQSSPPLHFGRGK
jgi:hypothetical protein